MNDFDARLRSRIIGLADAASQPDGRDLNHVGATPRAPARTRTRTTLPVGVLTLAVVLVAAMAILPHLGAQPGPAAATLSLPGTPSSLVTATPMMTAAPIPSPLPSGGISKERAIELAGSHTPFTTLTSAVAGRFRDLNTDPNIGPGYPIKPERLVWAVSYQGDMTICNPLGTCYSPSPGTVTVFLDYTTGDFLASEG